MGTVSFLPSNRGVYPEMEIMDEVSYLRSYPGKYPEMETRGKNDTIRLSGE